MVIDVSKNIIAKYGRTKAAGIAVHVMEQIGNVLEGYGLAEYGNNDFYSYHDETGKILVFMYEDIDVTFGKNAKLIKQIIGMKEVENMGIAESFRRLFKDIDNGKFD